MKVNNVNIIKNILYSVSSQVFIMLVTAAVTLVVPRYMGVSEYSYWQLYVFYSSYSGYFHFGWNDGFLLRNSGKKYEELNCSDIKSQFIVQTSLMLCISFFVFWGLIKFVNDISLEIVIALSINVIIVNLRYFLLCVFQCSSQFKNFSYVNIADRSLFVAVFLVLFVVREPGFEELIIADLAGKIFSFIFAVIVLKDCLSVKLVSWHKCFVSIISNIKVGLILMISSLANMLILGITRYKIESVWNIIVFGKISLCISITNLFITFVNAVGIIFFQILFKVDKGSQLSLYSIIRCILMMILMGILLIYFPLIHVLKIWLPQYADSFRYMIYLFPMCLFESKMVLLDSSFLKLHRLENKLFYINLCSVFVSAIFATISVDILKSIDLALLSIALISLFRCIMAEFFIFSSFKSKFIVNVFEELTISLLFMGMAIYSSNLKGFICFLFVYIVFIIKNKSVLLDMYNLFFV